jgi:RNA polymerase sigma-70 factor (ECF subfamily)
MSPSDDGAFPGVPDGLVFTETGAFRQFWEGLQPDLYQYARRRLPSHDAEEAVQDCFLAFICAVRGGIFIKSPRAYLFRTLQNKIAEHYRRPRDRERSNWDHLEDEATGEPSELSKLLRHEEHQMVRNAVHFLGEKHRQVVRFHYFGRLSLGEIAEALGIPVGTVKSRLHAARLELIRRIAEETKP